ncbi:MAG: hypothetical protein OXI25_08105 [Chloroflexota bacterium]|nr:hypothetical protein [Chloroflexota bacterium]
MPSIEDPDVKLLAAIADVLQEEYPASKDEWEGSPFFWTKTRPPRQQGAICERLLAGFLAAKGFAVTDAPDSEADRVVNGVRVEIKSSTLWKAGTYRFQQLRDQNYDIAICLGLSPFNVHCWVIPKSVIMSGWGTAKGLRSQHGGQQGSDTAWLAVDPNNVQSWLWPYGGSLAEAVEVLTRILRER